MRDTDPEDPLDFAQLRSASDASIRGTQPACEMRLAILRQLVGPYYPGDTGPTKREKRPVNLIDLMVDIYQRGLASHNPQVMVETDHEELLPTALDFETVLNRKIERMNLKEALNVCVIESMITMGVMCIGVGLSGEYEDGSAFAEPVLFPDLVLDLTAESWDQMSYVGHEFSVPLEWLEDNQDLETVPRDQFIEWSRTQQLSRGRTWDNSTQREEYGKLVRLRQLYLPREKKTVLFAVDGPNLNTPLRVSDWVGPYCGPYIKLAFRTIPGSVFPLGPLLAVFDLDDFVNKGFAKGFRQSERCKTIGLAQQTDDAAAIQAAGDGDIKNVSDPNSVVERTFGGANDNIMRTTNAAMELFMFMGGNLKLMGGLAPSAGTLGQDKLLSEAANGKLSDMQGHMTSFETEVVSSIGFWVWEDPTGEEKFTKRLEGTDFGIPAVWSPETRTGEFYQFNLSVNPYSKVKRSPSEQAAFITQILEQVILPAIPYMQQGSPIDWECFFKMLARYHNAPELNMLIKYPGGESMPGPTPDMPTKSPNTTRNYVRRDAGGQDPLAEAMQQFAPSGAQNGQVPQPMMSQ